MAKYRPADPVVMGELFRDLILAGQLKSGRGDELRKQVDSHGSITSERKAELTALLDREDELIAKFDAFVGDPAARHALLEQATLGRIPDVDDAATDLLALTIADKESWQVVVDDSDQFHITIPDSFMAIEDAVETTWLSELGDYIMRRCR